MDEKALLTEQLQKKWQPVLEHPDLPAIKDTYRKNVTTILLENQEQALLTEQPANKMGVGGSPHFGNDGGVDGFDPVLISLVRRSMPNLIAYDVCGVQPMTGPTGLIFAMRARYATQDGTEAFYNEALTSGTSGGGTNDAGVTRSGAHSGTDPLKSTVGATYTTGSGMNTAEGEGKTPNQMAFSIERLAVEAKTRTLKAEYSVELAQDLKAVHGLDAEAELANILSTEILAEINREIVRTIYSQATLGCDQDDLAVSSNAAGTTVDGVSLSAVTKGVYDLIHDSDGRWSAERFRGLNFQIEREANKIAKDTRRGKGNIIICSSDVASALSMSGILNHDPAFANLNVDDTGNTFVGVLNGRTKVYVDPYATNDYICAGYRGESQYDAGIYYCPYVPLQMMRAVDANTFQPKIGFKTRYGLVENPFSQGTTARGGTTMVDTARTNVYYRIFRVDNLHGIGYQDPVG
tara:strand:+ start:14497 stop:15888 length:1392 start_codon:yes stop_codon:yes gene_type:complete